MFGIINKLERRGRGSTKLSHHSQALIIIKTEKHSVLPYSLHIALGQRLIVHVVVTIFMIIRIQYCKQSGETPLRRGRWHQAQLWAGK